MHLLKFIVILPTLILATTEQVKNGGFEDSLSHWNSWGVKAKVIRENKKTYISIESKIFKWSGVNQLISLPSATTHIKVSGSMKATSVVSAGKSWENACIAIQFLDACGDLIEPYLPTVGEICATSDWIKYEREYSVQKGAQLLQVIGALRNSTGSVQFDNISVQFFDSSKALLDQQKFTFDPVQEIEVPEAGKQAAQITATGEKFLLYLPKNYDSTKVWPLVVYLHGASERSWCLDKLRNHGTISERIEAGEQFPFIMVAPLCPINSEWENSMILPVITQVVKKLPIDKNRVTLTGLSMGGIGAIRLAIESPELFAGVLVVAGNYERKNDHERLSAFKNLPLWIIHGKNDAIFSSDSISQFAKKVKDIGGDVTLTVYEKEDHVSSLKRAYKSKEIYQWLLTQKRNDW